MRSPIIVFLLSAACIPSSVRSQEMIWRPMGGVGISHGEADYQSIAIDDEGVVWLAYRDVATDRRTTVLRWDGDAWTAVGGFGISDGSAVFQDLAIAPDGSVWIAYRDNFHNGKTTVLRWDGAAWHAVGGPGISQGAATDQSIAVDGQGRAWVAYRDWPNGSRTTVLRWDGDYWEAVGGVGISADWAQFQSLAVGPDGSAWVAYKDGGDFGKTTVLRWSEEAKRWQAAGGQGISAGRSRHQSLVFDRDGVPWVAYEDYNAFRKATVLRWDAGSGGWTAVGGPGISNDRAWFQSLAFGPDGTAWIAFRDGSDDWPGAEQWNTTVMRWEGSAWHPVGGRGISRGSAHYHSLAIDPDGNPWLAYQDNFNHHRTTVISWQERREGDKEMWQYDLEMPLQVRLHQNYPNPFNPSSTIRFDLPRGSNVRIDIFTAHGRLVDTIVHGRLQEGSHEVEFELRDVPSGVYLYRLTAGGIVRWRTMVFLK